MMNTMEKKNATNLFVVDFFDKKIIGTNAAFKKAGKGSGAAYEELARLIEKHPEFELVKKEQKKSKEVKKTYNGLNFELMKEYIEIQPDADAVMKEYNAVKKMAEDSKRSVYPFTKKWFLDKFVGFDVNKAKEEIRDALMEKAKTSVKEEAQNSAEQETEKQAEVINMNGTPALADVA